MRQSSQSAHRQTAQHNEERPHSKGESEYRTFGWCLIICVIGSGQSQDALQTDTFDDAFQAKAVPYSAMQFPLSKGPQGWKKRARSPSLEWSKKYSTPESLKHGRVFVIDYVKKGG